MRRVLPKHNDDDWSRFLDVSQVVYTRTLSYASLMNFCDPSVISPGEPGVSL